MNAMPELRKHARQDVFSAVMITPEMLEGESTGAMAMAMDLSRGGTRLGLLEEWHSPPGVPLRLAFLFDTDHPIVLRGHVTRAAPDHLGVRFDPAQDEEIEDLLGLFEELP